MALWVCGTRNCQDAVHSRVTVLQELFTHYGNEDGGPSEKNTLFLALPIDTQVMKLHLLFISSVICMRKPSKLEG